MEKRIALTTCHGHVVGAEIASDGWALRGNRGRVFGWEALTLVAAGAGRVAVRTCHGFFVSALTEESGWLLCGNRLRASEWERFTPVEVGPFVALKTAHGRFVAAEAADDGWVLRGDRLEIGDWELFGGGEVEPAPPEGAPADAFAPFEEGTFVWHGSLSGAIRTLVGQSGPAVTDAEGERRRSSRRRAFENPVSTACGPLWL